MEATEYPPLPQLIFVTGKKRAGKSTICEALTQERGYHHIHIATPWICDVLCPTLGITPDEYLKNKGKYRAAVQTLATQSRAADPNILLSRLDLELKRLRIEDGIKQVVVDGIRFVNEVEFARERQALVLRVSVSDEERRWRFAISGEDQTLFDDPFEREIDTLPVTFEISGDLGLLDGHIVDTIETRWLNWCWT